jgi:hypothetical protein
MIALHDHTIREDKAKVDDAKAALEACLSGHRR